MRAVRNTDSATTGGVQSLLALAGLWSLGVAQPMLEVLATGAEFLVAHRLDGGRLAVLAVAVVVLPPLGLWTLEWLATRVGARLGRAVHRAFVLCLFAALACLVGRSLGLDGAAWLVGSLTAAVLLTVAYARWRGLRAFVQVLGVAVVVVPAVFLLSPQVRTLLGGAAADAETAAALQPVLGADTPVVWLVADEWALWSVLDGAGELDRASYPHLAALADDATWYRRAASVSGATELAVPAMLGGRLPEPDELPVPSHFPEHLFSLLPDYEIWAEEVVSFLCPPQRNLAAVRDTGGGVVGLASDLRWLYLHRLLPDGLRHRLPTVDDRWSGFGPVPAGRQEIFHRFLPRFRERMRRDRMDSFEHFLAALGPQSRRLYFLHLLLPHTPYEYLPDGRRYAVTSGYLPGLAGERWGASQARVDQSLQRYLLQVRLLDELVGRLVARLKEVGLYERAVVVLVSDHGISFRAGELRRTATADNAPELLPVPLLVKSPRGVPGTVVDEPFSLVDLLPLVLDAVDPATARRRTSTGWNPGTLPLVDADRGTRWLDSAEVFGGQPAASADYLGRFGRAAAGGVVLPTGPPDVVGHKVGDLGVDELGWRDADQGSVAIESRLASPGSPGELVSALIQGRLLAPLTEDPACCELALALDGTVVATLAVDASIDPVFSLVVPPPAERAQLGVYRLLPPTSTVRLERLAMRPQRVRDGPPAAAARTSSQGRD